MAARGPGRARMDCDEVSNFERLQVEGPGFHPRVEGRLRTRCCRTTGDKCDNRSATIHRADAGRGSQDLLEAHVEHQREKRRRVFEGLEGQEVAERVKLVGSAKVFKWPTRLGKMLHLAGPDLALREAAEKAERDRWLAMLRDIMKKASLPATRRSKRTR